jgi:hypothetical protein
MLFDAERGLPQGVKISCSFMLPDSMLVRTGAEIVRVVQKATEHDVSQFGVRFHGLRPEFRDAIEALVAKRSRRR